MALHLDLKPYFGFVKPLRFPGGARLKRAVRVSYSGNKLIEVVLYWLQLGLLSRLIFQRVLTTQQSPKTLGQFCC